MQPLTALSLWMWEQSRNWWQSSGMENRENIKSPNVDVSCVAVERRDQKDTALYSTTGNRSRSDAGKAGELCHFHSYIR